MTSVHQRCFLSSTFIGVRFRSTGTTESLSGILQELSNRWPLLPSLACATIMYHDRNYQNGVVCQNSGNLSACCCLEMPPQELSMVAASSLQTHQTALQKWHLNQSSLWWGRFSHPYPCREKGHQSLSRRTHKSLSSLGSGFDIPPIFTLGISTLKSPAPKEILFKTLSLLNFLLSSLGAGAANCGFTLPHPGPSNKSLLCDLLPGVTLSSKEDKKQ